jgi:hypothetical protein
VEWQTRRIPDTRLKSDGYRYRYEFLSTDTGTDINFYLQPLYWQTDNWSTRFKPDPFPSLLGSHGWVICVSLTARSDGVPENGLQFRKDFTGNDWSSIYCEHRTAFITTRCCQGALFLHEAVLQVLQWQLAKDGTKMQISQRVPCAGCWKFVRFVLQLYLLVSAVSSGLLMCRDPNTLMWQLIGAMVEKDQEINGCSHSRTLSVSAFSAAEDLRLHNRALSSSASTAPCRHEHGSGSTEHEGKLWTAGSLNSGSYPLQRKIQSCSIWYSKLWETLQCPWVIQ